MNADGSWKDGTGNCATFDDVVTQIACAKTAKVFIGTDSQMHGRFCNFTTAIVIYSDEQHHGGRFFVKRNIVPKTQFTRLHLRMLEEVQQSIAVSSTLKEKLPDIDIEIHIDSSPINSQAKTSKYSDSLIGFATGMGFSCKIKPEAWAASNVADKFTK